jgi:hypothetical protein
MFDDGLITTRVLIDIENITEFTDSASMERIINKITDYSDFIAEGKLAGLINYKYNLNSEQTNQIINLLLDIQAISKVFNIASKGLKDLEVEYVSNIFSETAYPYNISSYINMRNAIENRLNHQIQQYNINMAKNNTTLTMPLNELRGHIKTFEELSQENISLSTKAQHGYISASLHDAYVLLINHPEWWTDRTYMKYFFNDSDFKINDVLLISRKPRQSLSLIVENTGKILEHMNEAQESRVHSLKARAKLDEENGRIQENMQDARDRITQDYNDKMLKTPFGRQYGSLIDRIITEIFNTDNRLKFRNIADEVMREKIQPVFNIFVEDPGRLASIEFKDDISDIVDYLINVDYGIKTFTERFIYKDKKISFSKFYTEIVKTRVEEFITEVMEVSIKQNFNSLFKFIKSMDLKKFACAYIIKRIYLKEGDNLTTFGFFLIRTIGKMGGIKT